MPTWDSDQYRRFESSRTRPAEDLLARIPSRDPQLVVDVGCGPGNSTRLLRERWPAAEVIGLDSSSEMLDTACDEVEGASFVEADLRDWTPHRPADVVFSNATLQWVPDHERVLAHLLSWLSPGRGVLAVQMPDNYGAPSHALMRELAASSRWANLLSGVLRERPVSSPEEYFGVLSPHGEVDLWMTEYVHVLDGDDPVLEWVKGTGLRPVLDRLGEEDGSEFVDEYAARLRQAYPKQDGGQTLFPFRRLFFVVSG